MRYKKKRNISLQVQYEIAEHLISAVMRNISL